MSHARSPLAGTLLVLLAAALFGTLGPLSRTAYAAGLVPFAFVTWRAAIGSLGIWTTVFARRTRAGTGLGIRTMRAPAARALGLSIVASVALNLSIFLAFDRTSVALALLAFYTYPAIVTAASVALGREALDRARLVALLLAMVGMVAVVLGGADRGDLVRVDGFGIALALSAAVWQAVFVLASRGYSEVPTDEAMGTILAGTVVLAGGVTLATAGPAALTLPIGSAGLLGLLLLVGLGAAALPSSLFLRGIREIGVVRTGILMLFEPVVGVALAAIFLAEKLTAVQTAGGLTILLAALIVQRDAGRPIDEVAATAATPVVPAPGGP